MNPDTCAPTAATRPTMSWPGTQGNRVPTHSARTWRIRMADAAKGDVDLHVVRAWRAAVYLQRLQGFVTCMGAIGLNQHGDSFFLAIEGIFASPSIQPIEQFAGFLAY